MKILGIGEATVKEQIELFEQRIEARLFNREQGETTPTKFGGRFVEYARVAIQERRVRRGVSE